MPSTHGPIVAVVRHVETASARSSAQQVAAWRSRQPGLSEWPLTSPGDLAAAIRRARYSDQHRPIGCLLGVAAGDELAQLTVVAGLAGRLGAVVAGWVRAGVAAEQLAEMEHDLVAECWIAVAGKASAVAAGEAVPEGVASRLVDAARERVRVARRPELRVLPRRAPLDLELPVSAGRPVVEELADAVADAVRAGQLSSGSARPVFLTRVLGFTVAEAADRLQCSQAVLRAVRSRAERRLVA